MRKACLFACLFAFGALGLVAAQSLPSATTHDAGTLTMTAASQQEQQQPSQTFTGKIAQAEGKYVLHDNSTNATFQLDDQSKAKAFDGKSVKVTGTLDASSNTIHVVDIQEA